MRFRCLKCEKNFSQEESKKQIDFGIDFNKYKPGEVNHADKGTHIGCGGIVELIKDRKEA